MDLITKEHLTSTKKPNLIMLFALLYKNSLSPLPIHKHPLSNPLIPNLSLHNFSTSV
jgi:hypothetical protein